MPLTTSVLWCWPEPWRGVPCCAVLCCLDHGEDKFILTDYTLLPTGKKKRRQKGPTCDVSTSSVRFMCGLRVGAVCSQDPT